MNEREVFLVIKLIETFVPGSVWLHLIVALIEWFDPKKFATIVLLNGPKPEEGIAVILHKGDRAFQSVMVELQTMPFDCAVML